MEITPERLTEMLREAFQEGAIRNGPRANQYNQSTRAFGDAYAAEQVRRLVAEREGLCCEPCSRDDHQHCILPCACYIAGQVGPFPQEKPS